MIGFKIKNVCDYPTLLLLFYTKYKNDNIPYRQMEIVGHQLLRYGGSPYGQSMGRICSPGTENVVTLSYFMIL